MAKIVVLGDAFIDTYHIGNVRGLSAEAPIPIVDIISQTNLPGGAGNVAVNLDGLGGDVFYLERLDQNYPIKNRLMLASGEQLARWDENDHCLPYTSADLSLLMEADAVIVSDYGKGSINEEVIQLLRQVAMRMPVFVDTKGDPTPWIGADVTMFPNMDEYKRYEDKYNWFGQVVLKRGAEGLAFLEFGSVVYQLPASTETVRSVNGAGDTVIAAFTLAAMAGVALPECILFANTAAGIVVGQHFLRRTTTRQDVLERIYPSDEYSNKSETCSHNIATIALLPSGSGDVGGSYTSEDFDKSYRPTSTDGVTDETISTGDGPTVTEEWTDAVRLDWPLFN